MSDGVVKTKKIQEVMEKKWGDPPSKSPTQRVTGLIRVICFLTITVLMFVVLGNLIGTGDDRYDNRGRIAGFYKQPKDSIDVVLMGSSAIYRGWSSMVAWHEYGITSYAWSTSAQPAAAYRFIIKDVLKRQSPDVFVINTRPFKSDLSPDNEHDLGAIRKVTDNMPFSLNRKQAIDYILDSIGVKTDNFKMDYYFSFILYHNRWKEGLDALNIGEDRYSRIKGTRIGPEIFRSRDLSSDVDTDLTDERLPLSESNYENLINLLEWLKEEDIPVVFLRLPYVASEKEHKILNTVADIIDDYGFEYLDFSDGATKMGIDFSSDFYDKKHLNVYGMEKSTKWLSEYLIENYDLTDHRGDEKYADWNEAYELYLEQMQNYKDKNKNDSNG